PVDDSFPAKTVFLRAVIPLEFDVVIGDAAPDIDLSALGHLWADIKAHDGVYSFEIATELPYFLPTLENKPEYFVTVGDVELFICLRMIRAFRGPGYPLT